MKIYIAGKITGDPNYREKFHRAEELLISQEHIVLNPAKLPEGMTPAEYMRICIPMLEVADLVFLLPDYADSPGARLEYAYCKYVGKPTRIMMELR